MKTVSAAGHENQSEAAIASPHGMSMAVLVRELLARVATCDAETQT